MRAALLVLALLTAPTALADGGTDLGVDTGFEHAKSDDLPIVATVHFFTGSAELTARGRATLEPVARQLAAEPSQLLELAGHTDSSGKETLNTGLSERRARAVGKYLVDHGVAGSRISVLGYGSFEPVADNRTDAGRALNRRAEVKLSR